MHSQEFGNDEGQTSDPLAVVAIIPEKVQHDAREQIVIAFNRRMHVKGRSQFVVDFVGRAGAVQISAKQLNSSTLILETPAYPEASVVTVYVYHGIHRQLLGQHRFEFLSRNDTFYRLLYGALDPVKFMCESLQISPAEVQGLDSALAETFQANAPEGFHLLGIHKNVAGDSSAEHPTLLHFASQFGLSKLISNLLRYPGAQEACKIRNYHGQWPYNIAESYGFDDLAHTLRCFRDQGDPDQIYTDMGHDDDTSYYVKMQKDDGSYYYVSMNGEGHELYVDMQGKRYINLDKDEEEERYLMKKQNDDGSYYYVPMKGEAGPGGKLYEDVKEKKPYNRPVPNPPESEHTTEDLYQNFKAGSAASNDQDDELYEPMERNAEGEEVQEEMYMPMDHDQEKGENPSELYIDMEDCREPGPVMSKEYVGYVKPRSNLPVNPNPDFYRSASNAAAIRAKEIENQERKTMSLPAGGMSQFQRSVAEGRCTQEDVAELMKLMKKMGIPSDTAPQIRPRQGSTSSKSSTSTTSSSGSSGVGSGHEFIQQQESEGLEEEEEPIHSNLAKLFPHLKQKEKAQVQSKDVPPPVPRPDYGKESPVSKRRHPRSKTTPVRQEDVQAGVFKTSTSPAPPLPRRNSEPQATGADLDIQSRILSKKNPPQPSLRPPALIPEHEPSRPPKSPPPTPLWRPMPSPPPDNSRPPAPPPGQPKPFMGIPVFPDTPPPPKAPRPAPRNTQK